MPLNVDTGFAECLQKNDLEEATEGGTFVSAAGGTFETVLGGTIKPLPSENKDSFIYGESKSTKKRYNLIAPNPY